MFLPCALLTIPISVHAVLGNPLFPKFLFKLKPSWTYLFIIILSTGCPQIQKLPLKSSNCFQNITGFCTASNHNHDKHSFIYWKLWSEMFISHLRMVLLLSALFQTRFIRDIIIGDKAPFLMNDHPFVYMIDCKNSFFAPAAESGPRYFTSTFSTMHNFCSRLSI